MWDFPRVPKKVNGVAVVESSVSPQYEIGFGGRRIFAGYRLKLDTADGWRRTYIDAPGGGRWELVADEPIQRTCTVTAERNCDARPTGVTPPESRQRRQRWHATCKS